VAAVGMGKGLKVCYGASSLSYWTCWKISSTAKLTWILC